MTLSLAFDAKQTQAERVYDMLLAAHRRGEYVTNAQFCAAYIPNFRSRFKEVKAMLAPMGLTISKAEYVREGLWRYRVETI